MVAVAAKAEGFDVHVAAPFDEDVEKIIEHGFHYHKIELDRKGQNPYNELKLFFCLFKLLAKLKPDIAHFITIKPIIYGGIAARFVKLKLVVMAISGLGTVFINNSLKSKIRQILVLGLYKLAFRQKCINTIFQNPYDQEFFVSKNLVKLKDSIIIPGSGVDLSVYKVTPEPSPNVVVLMVSRLLIDKGVYEFARAANELYLRGIKVEMRVIGDIDTGSETSLSREDVLKLSQIKNLNFLGYCDDIASAYASSNIACLPSYREGLPKSLIEASACGRPIVTTDAPGCRDAIVQEKTGLMVPTRNANLLADALERLIVNPVLRQKMGVEARNFAEQKFSLTKVIEQHLNIYSKIRS